MESITKNRQTPDTLRAMVARAYGPEQVIEDDGDWVAELGHGWFNVATGSGYATAVWSC